MEHVVDLLPGYALGCLDEDELLQVARHLPQCASCREELASYWTVVDRLPLSLTLQTPSPGLKDKILAGIDRPGVTRPVQQKETPARQTGVGGFFQSLFGRPASFALAALALVFIVLLSLSNWMLWRQVNDLQARLPAGNMQFVQLSGTENAPGTYGYLMVFHEENYGTLVVEDAPSLPSGYQYQLWLIRDGKRSSGGVFSVDPDGYGVLEISSDLPLDTFSSFGITVEPQGGSSGPTGQKILGGDL